MFPPDLHVLLVAVLEELHPGGMTDEFVQTLRHIFPDKLLLAALDLVDRERVIKFETAWGRVLYEVLGSELSYTVHPTLSPRNLTYCSCPSFTSSVLLSGDLVMCKHVLAVRLAQRLGKCVDRSVTEEELSNIISRQTSNIN